MSDRFTWIFDRGDMGVLQPGGGVDLALEALGAERLARLGMEHLERDGAVVPDVNPGPARGQAGNARGAHRLNEVDRGHTAAPELALEQVAIPNSQRRVDERHELAWRGCLQCALRNAGTLATLAGTGTLTGEAAARPGMPKKLPLGWGAIRSCGS